MREQHLHETRTHRRSQRKSTQKRTPTITTKRARPPHTPSARILQPCAMHFHLAKPEHRQEHTTSEAKSNHMQLTLISDTNLVQGIQGDRISRLALTTWLPFPFENVLHEFLSDSILLGSGPHSNSSWTRAFAACVCTEQMHSCLAPCVRYSHVSATIHEAADKILHAVL